MIIGRVACSDIMPLLYQIGIINLIFIIVLGGYLFYSQRKLAKDNGILAAMIKRIMSDLPN